MLKGSLRDESSSVECESGNYSKCDAGMKM